MTDHDQVLNRLSPLDGRYAVSLAPLRVYFSEAGLYRYRVRVELEYLILLARAPGVHFVPPLTVQQVAALRDIYLSFDEDDAIAIAEWDRKVNHDVKAVEYWLREQLTALGLEDYHEAIHFALTSEDVNNVAYALLVREARDEVLLPAVRALHERLTTIASREAASAMLARTHGQPATPTTLGKEFAVFAGRLQRATDDLAAIRLTGKLNGASGTFAAHVAALPDVNWLAFSTAFLKTLELEPVLLTTQIEPHDTLAALCDAVRRLNTILLDLSQDCWRYISDGYFGQTLKVNEVGSSTMPHKVNPIDFENSEGNLGIANALLEFFSRKLPVSRLQRDLSDSTVLRNLGVAFGHSLIAYQRLTRSLDRLAVNHAQLQRDLEAHPEVLAEAIQTLLRREGYAQPYEALKQLTRGNELTIADIHTFVNTLDVSPAVRDQLQALRPELYIGLSEALARLHERKERSLL